MSKDFDEFDLTPSWTGLMPGIIAMLENPDNSQAGYRRKQPARDELMRMARVLDSVIEATKEIPNHE